MKRILAVAALAGAGLASAVLPASASVHHHYAQLPGLAITHLSNRLDSGDHGNYWATDTIQRNLTIKHVGGNSYTATVTDEGSFKTIVGADTPGPAAPVALTTSVKPGSHATIAGTATYSFTADRAPDFSLVPNRESGTPAGGTPQTTSLWFEQAFPAGTVFGGPGLTGWGWGYDLTCTLRTGHQHWTDSDSLDAGNIFGC